MGWPDLDVAQAGVAVVTLDKRHEGLAMRIAAVLVLYGVMFAGFLGSLNKAFTSSRWWWVITCVCYISLLLLSRWLHRLVKDHKSH